MRDIIETDPTEMFQRCGMNLSGSGWGATGKAYQNMVMNQFRSSKASNLPTAELVT
jgi:hypothetical protein